MTPVSQSTLQNVFFNSSYSSLKKTLTILFGVVLLTIASQLSIPLTPVPLTFQSTMVIFIGMAMGPRYAAYVIATYLFLGSIGLPVFANYTAGFMTFFSPLGGYLMGFLPAALISGYLAQKGFAKNSFLSFLAGFIGTTIIFLLGVMVLSNFIGFKNAIAFGLMPFILSEPLKLIAMSLVIPRFWKLK